MAHQRGPFLEVDGIPEEIMALSPVNFQRVTELAGIEVLYKIGGPEGAPPIKRRFRLDGGTCPEDIPDDAPEDVNYTTITVPLIREKFQAGYQQYLELDNAKNKKI